jgi:uncharacterized protein with NAD-binding domain and iron-sulfur cluster
LREVYDAYTPPLNSPLQKWTDAVKPQTYTPIGVLRDDHRWTYWPVTWPTNNGVPGDSTLMPTLMQMIQVFIGWVKELLEDAERPEDALAATAIAGTPPARFVTAGLPPTWGAHALPEQPSIHSVLQAAHAHALSFGPDHRTRSREDLHHLTDLLDWTATAASGTIGKRAVPASNEHILLDLLEILRAVVRGIVFDLLIPDRPFEALDEEDLRDWLIRHKADQTVVRTSSIVRIVYDTLFQYRDGDVSRPSYAAGTGLGVIMRLLGTYKGAMMWDIQAGMGEAVVAPLYEVLRSAGVKFKFFRKVTKLEVSPDGKRIQRVQLDRQADTLGPEYSPLMTVDGLQCWPAEPLWNQLTGGPALQQAKVNFESHWCDHRSATETLEFGKDFDAAVLAISLGAYKKLNSDPSMCDELIAKGGRFADFVNKIDIVPSQAVQLWFDSTPEELGWKQPKAATVGGPEYLNISADMSQVLKVEPRQNTSRPKSLYYLTGTYSTQLYKEPTANKNVPAQAAKEIGQTAVDWLNNSSYALWSGFNWSMLTDPTSATGEARFSAQFWRANIDPTECCTLSAAGSTKYRLLADESGFENLVLAGEGTRHGFNTTTIEGAVMSGAAASQVICGEPKTVIGYDFLRRKPSQGPG